MTSSIQGTMSKARGSKRVTTGEAERGPRRCLFGRPDPKEVDDWLEEKLEKINNEGKQRYNFDFETEEPLEGGDFEYEAVPANQIPQFYHPRAHYKSKKRPEPPCPSVTPPHEVPMTLTVAAGEDMSDVEPRVGVVTRSAAARRAARLQISVSSSTPRQTKMTEYMSARKRRSGSSKGSASAPAKKLIRMDDEESPSKAVSLRCKKETASTSAPTRRRHV